MYKWLSTRQTACLPNYAFSLCILCMISAFWIESDIYRYVGAGVYLFTLTIYFRDDFFDSSKVLIGWPGIACLGWAFYLLTRGCLDLLSNPDLDLGGAEGIYLLPLVYPTLGYAFYKYAKNPYDVVRAFIFVSLIFLIIGTDYRFFRHIFLDFYFKSDTFLHNNTIHASVGSGFIFIASLYFLLYLMDDIEISIVLRRTWQLIGVIVAGLAVINIVSLQSKGVWLALFCCIPVVVIHIFKQITVRVFLVFTLFSAIATSIVSQLLSSTALHHANRTIQLFLELVHKIAAGNSLVESLDILISNGDAPASAETRMMLWSDAISIWKEQLFLGNGLEWYNLWLERTYQETTSGLLHNGYLEIAVRYGFIGLFFYGWLYTWSIIQVSRSAKEKIITLQAARCYYVMILYFSMTLLSNSNIRLAIGESFMWCTAAFGFYCYFLLQKAGSKRPQTYI